jgi:hypothetical protein
LRAASIIDCPADSGAVLASLQRVFDGRFQPDPGLEPPYGRGGASEAIAGTLRMIDLRGAFPKHFHDLAAPQEPSGTAV